MKKHFLTIIFLIIIFFMGICTTLSMLMDNDIELTNLSVTQIEAEFDENIFAERAWIEVFGLYNNIIDKSIIEAQEQRYSVYKMNNNQLTWNYEYIETEDLTNNYISFANKVEKSGVPIFYVQAPFKINKYDNQLPYEMEDTTNGMADEIVNKIRGAGCEVLDLREVIWKNGIAHEELFFNTDHHWTPEAGLWATEVIVNHINSYKVLFDDSYLQEDDYEYEVLENIFCGSQGKRVGMLYSGLDDMSLITPNYLTNYQYYIPVIDYDKSGRYEDVLLFHEYLEYGFLSDDVNRVYTGDNYSYSYMRNNNAVNETSVLLIRDSFSRVVAPFLISSCEELHIVDLRTYNGDLVGFIRENQIDVVIVLYNPSVVVNEDFFVFE